MSDLANVRATGTQYPESQTASEFFTNQFLYPYVAFNWRTNLNSNFARLPSVYAHMQVSVEL